MLFGTGAECRNLTYLTPLGERYERARAWPARELTPYADDLSSGWHEPGTWGGTVYIQLNASCEK